MPTDKLEDFILNNRDNFDTDTPPAGLWDRIEAAIEPEGDDDHDPLAGFVADNRDAFDDATPPPELEGLIFAAVDTETEVTATEAPAAAGASPMPPVSNLRVASRRRTLRILGIAASFLLLLFAAFTLGNNRGYRAAEDDLVAAQLHDINPELVETENYYREEIATQFTRVNLVNDDPQLREDLAAIDAATEEIRNELLEVPVSQRAALVDRLIDTYRTKLDILLRIQEHLPPTGTPDLSTTQQPTDEL